MLNPMIELRDYLFKKEDPTRHPAIQQPRRRTLAGTNAHAFASQMRARTKRSSDETIELSNNPLTPIAENGRAPSPVVVFNMQKTDDGVDSPTLSPKRMKSRSLPSFSDFAKLGGFGRGATSTGKSKGNKKRGLLGVIGESGSDDEEEKKDDGDLEEGQ